MLCRLFGHQYYMDLDGDHGGANYCPRCGVTLNGSEPRRSCAGAAIGAVAALMLAAAGLWLLGVLL